MKFNERLRTLRRARGYTQQDIADRLDYRASTVGNYETGKNEPSIKDLIKLANILNVSVDYLIGASDTYRAFDRGFVDEK